MSEGFRYTLGSTVKDKITGYEGIIVAATEFLYSCRLYEVQSTEMKDGVPVESKRFDEDSLALVKAVKHKPQPFKYELGSLASDKVTGYKGLVTARSHVLYQPNHYSLQAQELKDGVPVKGRGQLEDGIELAVAAEPHKVRATGGPGDDAPSVVQSEPRARR